MEIFLKADTWLALLTLCFLEIVLGIDNIIFISIVSNKLPEELRQKARNTGLFLAMFVRIGFLLYPNEEASQDKLLDFRLHWFGSVLWLS